SGRGPQEWWPVSRRATGAWKAPRRNSALRVAPGKVSARFWPTASGWFWKVNQTTTSERVWGEGKSSSGHPTGADSLREKTSSSGTPLSTERRQGGCSQQGAPANGSLSATAAPSRWSKALATTLASI